MAIKVVINVGSNCMDKVRNEPWFLINLTKVAMAPFVHKYLHRRAVAQHSKQAATDANTRIDMQCPPQHTP